MFIQVMKFLGVSMTGIGVGLQGIQMALPKDHPSLGLQITALILSSLGGACAVFSPSVQSTKGDISK